MAGKKHPDVPVPVSGGPSDGDHGGPERRCIATGRVLPWEELLRFVLGPGDVVVPDLDGKLPGRGFWLSAVRDMVETAVRKGSFAKVARRGVVVPADLPDQVDRLMVRRCLDYLGLSRRAGLVVFGYEKVHAGLKAGRLAMLLAARDGAPGGREKIRRLGPGLPLIDLFSGAELGAALGRDEVVHVAVGPGRVAALMLEEAFRLGRYRGTPVPMPGPVGAGPIIDPGGRSGVTEER